MDRNILKRLKTLFNDRGTRMRDLRMDKFTMGEATSKIGATPPELRLQFQPLMGQYYETRTDE